MLLLEKCFIYTCSMPIVFYQKIKKLCSNCSFKKRNHRKNSTKRQQLTTKPWLLASLLLRSKNIMKLISTLKQLSFMIQAKSILFCTWSLASFLWSLKTLLNPMFLDNVLIIVVWDFSKQMEISQGMLSTTGHYLKLGLEIGAMSSLIVIWPLTNLKTTIRNSSYWGDSHGLSCKITSRLYRICPLHLKLILMIITVMCFGPGAFKLREILLLLLMTFRVS